MSSADTEYDTFEQLVNIETEGTSFAVPGNTFFSAAFSSSSTQA